MAWLHTAPSSTKKGNANTEIHYETRYEQYKNGGEVYIKSPPVRYGHHILELFKKSGMIMQTPMGASWFTWGEIESFVNCQKLNLSSWEINLLRRMSMSYYAMSQRAKEPSCPSPYEPQDTRSRNKRNEFVTAAFKALAKRINSRKKKPRKKRSAKPRQEK